MKDEGTETFGGIKIGEESQNIWRKSAPVSIYPPHKLIWD
jgi:hypothetical protein